MAGLHEELKCNKWTLKNRRYVCQQSNKNCCGCWSSISCPNVDLILSTTQKNRQKIYINEIKQSIKEQNAALVLGAGISKPSNLPLWNELISKMMGYAIQYSITGRTYLKISDGGATERARIMKMADQLIEGKLSVLSKVNALEAAEYVAQFFDDDSASKKLRTALPETSIRTMIYRMLEDSFTPDQLLRNDCKGKETTSPMYSAILNELDVGLLLKDVVRHYGEENIAKLNTMFAVSFLLSHESGIRKAMTYNYDPLVQEHMIDLYGLDKSAIYTHPGMWNAETVRLCDDARELFHVHGFVAGERHEKRNEQTAFPSESGPLVLSEDSYYHIEREEAYNWSSSIQSYFLNKYNCMFVGFSAEDYNFRRILRQMGENDSQKTRQHYLILTIDDWIRNTYEDVCHTCLMESEKINEASLNRVSEDTALLMQYILQCRADYWGRFNIRPIWVTVKEIPELLTSLIV